jgi:hypothetical protein
VNLAGGVGMTGPFYGSLTDVLHDAWVGGR